MKLFGFSIRKNKETVGKLSSFTGRDILDGSTEIYGVHGGYYGYQYNADTKIDNENGLITKYRELAGQALIERAVSDIVNEAFSYDSEEMPIKIVLDNIDEAKLPKKIKERIIEEFEYLLELLNFRSDCYDIFKRWYVDGRLYYEKIIDKENPGDGIKQLKNIDPRKIRKITETEVEQYTGKNRPPRIKTTEYFLYNPKGLLNSTTTNQQSEGIQIAKDTVTYIHSGLFEKDNKMILSHLHKAIRPYNQLRRVEDAVVIYRLARSSETRVFNFEVGELTKSQAEEHVAKQINRIRKKPIYNAETGDVETETRFMTLMEDYFFAQRDGKGTSVDVLSGGENLGQIEDIEYFRRDLYQSLNIPISRLEVDAAFTIGRSSEITRDELKFSKFVNRLRKRFSKFFDDILGTHLILKNILTVEEWDNLKKSIVYDYLKDNHFAEFKEGEIWRERFATMSDVADLVEQKYLSRSWVRRNILRLTDEETEQIKDEIEKEKEESGEEDDESF